MPIKDFSAHELQSILQFTVDIVQAAGKVILEGSDAIHEGGLQFSEKKSSVDIVTEYDVRVEDMVKESIKKAYPDFAFIGEESYAAGSQDPLTDQPTFCVDPIDGTTNFVHGYPWVCISIGLICNKKPVLGVIFNPFLNQLYTAAKGQGSYLSQGGRPPVRLPLAKFPKPLSSLSEAQIAVEWGNDRSIAPLTKRSESFHQLAGDPRKGVEGGRMVHSIRSSGSSVLNFAMVGQGGLDIYWEVGCWPWDVCAAMVIAEEAGAMITGSHALYESTKELDSFGESNGEVLMGRKYLVVRSIGDTENETGRDAQKRIIKEFYSTVQDYNVAR